MYGKFHASTFTGSMRGSGPIVFAVWGYIISNTNQHSVIEINPEIVAFLLGCEPIEIERALKILCAPDLKSRSKENNGCRLVKEGEYQYFVPTHKKYREMKNTEEKREYNRVKKQEQRARDGDVKHDVKNVKVVNTSEAEAETKEDIKKEAANAAMASKESSKTLLLVKRWASEYEKVFTEKYKVNWGKDGKAAKDLLDHEPSEDKIMKIAVAAWGNLEGFRCKNAVTLSGLNGSFNEIRSELNARVKGSKPKPIMKPSFDEIMEKQNENT